MKTSSRKLRRTDQSRIKPSLAALENAYNERIRTLEALRATERVNAPKHVSDALYAEHSHAHDDFGHTLKETRAAFGDQADRLVNGLGQRRGGTV